MNKSKQLGTNLLTLLWLLVSVGLFLTGVIKLLPVYLDNLHVESALKELAKKHREDLQHLGRETIRQELAQIYTINNVRGDVAKALEVERHQGRTLIKVAYEVRIPFAGGINVVWAFNNVLDTSKPDKCCSDKTKDDKSGKK